LFFLVIYGTDHHWSLHLSVTHLAISCSVKCHNCFICWWTYLWQWT